MASVQVDRRRPGVIRIPGLNREVKLSESREGDVYDTVEQGSGSISADTTLQLFNSLTNKKKQHTNLIKNNQINAHNELFMTRVGLLIHQCNGNSVTTDDDILRAAYGAYVDFKVNDRQVALGPVFAFQSGYGVQGSTTRNDTGIATLGVPSAAAAPNLLVVQPVTDKDSLNGDIIFGNRAWASTTTMPSLDGDTLISIHLHGVLKAPVTA